MKKSNRQYAVVFALFSMMLSLSFVACGPDHLFREIQKTDQESWSYDAPLHFKTTITDTSALYDVFIILDHLKSYPFENLYLRINQQAGQESQTDTLTLDIMSKDGYYKGKCDEESCEMKALIFDHIRYVQPGPLNFTVEQFTRNKSLEGIKAVGLEIRKVPLNH